MQLGNRHSNSRRIMARDVQSGIKTGHIIIQQTYPHRAQNE